MQQPTTVMSARELAAQIRFRGAVATFARLQAKDRVKELLRAEGRKIQEFTAKEIALLAEDYLAEHRDELIPQAKKLAEEILTKQR